MTMEKAIRFPNDLLDGCDTASALKLDGVSAIGQCIVTAGQHGTFFLQQHLLYVVLDGKVELKIGRQTVTLHKDDSVEEIRQCDLRQKRRQQDWKIREFALRHT